MTELHTLTFILKMCGIMMMEGTIQPSEAFECKQAELIFATAAKEKESFALCCFEYA